MVSNFLLPIEGYEPLCEVLGAEELTRKGLSSMALATEGITREGLGSEGFAFE